jgi:hypothetical protein
MFLNVQAATAFFEGFGQAIASVFEGLVTGTQNAKAAFLNFIATILAQMGSMAIAIGTIFPFHPWLWRVRCRADCRWHCGDGVVWGIPWIGSERAEAIAARCRHI